MYSYFYIKTDCRSNTWDTIEILDYLRSFRLQKAVEMLGRDISVKEVAAACGFRESNYFIRVFRSCFEKTPLEFRKTLPTHYSALEMEE